MQEEVTLERTLRQDRGRLLPEGAEDHGVEIHGGEDVERFEGVTAASRAVVTKTGTRIPADAVIVGVGVDARRDAGQARRPRDRRARRRARPTRRWPRRRPDVFAAGDIAEYDERRPRRRHVRIEHWDVAENQGKTAALAMLGREQAARRRPVLLLGPRRLDLDGVRRPGLRVDEEIVRGSIDDGQVHDLLPRRRPPRGRAARRTAPTTSSRRAS